MILKNILFDCDGTLVDTERDGHRVAFNKAFEASGLPVNWSVDAYGELLKVGGGKERMRHYFNTHEWPCPESQKDGLILDLHRMKTEIFMRLIDAGSLPLRPGIGSLVDEIVAEGDLKWAVCSTSNERSVRAVVDGILGPERSATIAGLFAGDMAKKKKPDPEIYNLAVRELAIKPEETLAIEDTRQGLLAAKAAGLKCVITPSAYSEAEDFSEADLVITDLGQDPEGELRRLRNLF